MEFWSHAGSGRRSCEWRGGPLHIATPAENLFRVWARALRTGDLEITLTQYEFLGSAMNALHLKEGLISSLLFQTDRVFSFGHGNMTTPPASGMDRRVKEID